jgi:hypothetical protein
LYVSMMRGAGIDSGMAMSSGLLLVAEAHGAGVKRSSGVGGLDPGGHPLLLQGQADY